MEIEIKVRILRLGLNRKGVIIINMVNRNLETKTKKAVLNIEEKVAGMYDVLCDLSLKLLHMIEKQKDYYGCPNRDGYYR